MPHRAGSSSPAGARAPIASRCRLGCRGHAARAALVLAFELLGDLVEHLDAARLEHVVEVAQLVGVGLEIGERREDLAGRDEAALAHVVEHADHARARTGAGCDAVATRPGARVATRRGRPRVADSPSRASGSIISAIGDPPYQLLGDRFGRLPLLVGTFAHRARRAVPSAPTIVRHRCAPSPRAGVARPPRRR